ncbi:DNA mismatch repair endonuclease MutL [Parvularcula lutaonensis]|uniref:DNA mismatch repair protein MutL n=1 Tax=Parvularcula lutaonensis TaxID=491923 RepID=A0ABV7MA09_9PROT|nr:DNA mismatch repair endonuclease MutL [Parvularcula lutaonensis]GGY43762.1 DNA mismatch repair protein MutL [Parvularcula lutaonensis]
MSPTERASLHPRIRRLPAGAVNRIAAGEVIERPAAAVKELVENALDAGATRIAVEIEEGGRKLIAVTDDGCGMGPEELPLALERHATSKLNATGDGEVDLLTIDTMGFRGEALPSIGAVARLTITSRVEGGEGWQLSVKAGVMAEPCPAPFAGTGTRVEVADLFFATPARLKFMKGERAEGSACADAVKRLAMARPDVAFTLTVDGRQRFAYRAEPPGPEGHLARLSAIMGRDFGENAVPVALEREGMTLSGFAGVPTFNRGLPDKQYLFVRGRPVRDKLMVGAVRGAYADFLARDRHPLLCLFLDMPSDLVDVNVHPAKTEVRFRDAALVRGMIVSGLRTAIAEAGHKASTTVAAQAMRAAQTGRPQVAPPEPRPSNPFLGFSERQTRLAPVSAPSARRYEPEPDAYPAPVPQPEDYPLGTAMAQLHDTYIVAQTSDGLVIVDQHAAHERLVYERIKQAGEGREPQRQALLVPEVVELAEDEATLVLERKDELSAYGLVIEDFGGGAVLVREVPAVLGEFDIKGLVKNIACDLAGLGQDTALKDMIAETLGNHACRNSVRAGRRLTTEEMNALLRQMEATPHSGQCNHGRPTYVELKLKDVERLFGRR